jgi:hypothetical protein
MRDFDVLGEGSTASNLFVQFYSHPVQNEAKSAEAGRPVFEDVDYIRIQVPGDKTTRIERPVRPDDVRAHRIAHEAYKAGKEAPTSGTPLKEWPAATRAQVEELAYFKVYTVEHLAGLSDGNAQNLGPILALRQKARDFLEAAKATAPMASLRAELERKDAELAALRAQMAKMNETLERLDKKGKG